MVPLGITIVCYAVVTTALLQKLQINYIAVGALFPGEINSLKFCTETKLLYKKWLTETKSKFNWKRFKAQP